jgi:cell division septum initiation protein DivIVA
VTLPAQAPPDPEAFSTVDPTTVDSSADDEAHALPGTLLDELTDLVETARAMPMSASCVVNRAEVLALLDQLRSQLPPALAQASAVLDERDTVVAEAHGEADRIRAEAEAERARRVAQHEIVVQAQAEAARLTEEARYHADAMRMEVEDYVDAKLANFEIVLNKTLSAVARGRDKLSGRHDLDSLGDQSDDRPLP